MTADGGPARACPPLKVPPGWEINHHRVTVRFTGSGKVELSVAHGGNGKLAPALAQPNLHSRFQTLTSGREVTVVSTYPGERHAWVVLRTAGDVRITDIRHACWLGRGTLYGHVGRTFDFAGAKLPYRLMYPRDCDPRRKYPLVVSVAGSGSVGTDNARSMEMVILARYLFTQYFGDKPLACFSLVTQIPRRTGRGAPSAGRPPTTRTGRRSTRTGGTSRPPSR